MLIDHSPACDINKLEIEDNKSFYKQEIFDFYDRSVLIFDY